MAGNIYHSWNGTVLTIESDSGVSSCDLKGATGDTGIRGPQGPKGEKGNGIDSVNGKIGDVVLTYEDVGALPDTYIPPVTKVNSKTGEVTLTYEDVGALPNTYVAPVTSVNTKTGAVQLTYSDVNAAAANHTHTAADVGALPSGGTAADSSKLGGVAAEDYALKTDTAPDSIKLGGKAPEYYVQPRNLLDNSDFTNLVAQAGIGGNHGTVAYAADRWALISGTVSYTAGTGLTLNGTITQKLENAPAAAYPYVGMVSGTASIIYADGAITITSSGGVIQWAALYTTEYTADTLPPYVPKGYVVELAECQRYFYTIISYWKWVSAGICTSSTDCNIPIHLPQPMRIMPTVTIADRSLVKIRAGSVSSQVPSAVSWSNITHSFDILQMTCTITGATNGDIAMLYFDNGGRIDFSADL